MGRHRQGWKIRPPREGRAVWTVRWWNGERQVERSTGATDRRAASEAAARLYAAAVHAPPRIARGVGSGAVTAEVSAQWLASLRGSHADGTIATWEVYARGFVEWFPTLPDLTPVRAAEYVSARLRQVRAVTVRKEATALRSLVAWLRQYDWIGWDVPVPPVPRGALGTPHPKRHRVKAPKLSPAEVERFLKALPVRSERHGFPVRARFAVAYWTGLRPSTLDRLSVPEHYQRGASILTLTEDADKNRWGREVPLAPEARKALDSACPEAGLIFERHDYREHIATAAAAVLDAKRASVFTAAHLRSARATHLCEKADALNLPGIQYLLGHRQLSTTSGYIEPSLRAARAALKQGRGRR